MKRSSTALAGLAVAAGLTGGGALAAEAHPAQLTEHTAAHHAPSVAISRLHALLQPAGAELAQIRRPDDQGVSYH